VDALLLLVPQMASHGHPQQQTCAPSASSSVLAASASRAQRVQPLQQQQQVKWRLRPRPPLLLLLLLLLVQLVSAVILHVCFHLQQQQQLMGQLIQMMTWM
jgi:hypothetical protein